MRMNVQIFEEDTIVNWTLLLVGFGLPRIDGIDNSTDKGSDDGDDICAAVDVENPTKAAA